MPALKQVVRFIVEQSDENMLGYRLMAITNAVVKAVVAVYVCGLIAGEFFAVVYAAIKDALVHVNLAQLGEPFTYKITQTGDVLMVEANDNAYEDNHLTTTYETTR